MDIDGLFHAEFPKQFQRALIQGIHSSYGQAHGRCFAEYDYPEAHYLWPHERRANIERMFRQLAAQYGMSGQPQPFDRNGEFYTLIDTLHFQMTVSAVPERYQLPRKALARDTLAKDQQFRMFEEQEAPFLPGTKLYTIIVHSASSDDSNVVAFVDAIFPSRDFTSILYRIPLLNREGGSEDGSATPVENIPDEPGPTLRDQEDAGA